MEFLTLSNELNTIEIREIMELLPHRYPFLLVDRVTDYELGQSIKAYKNITFNEPCFTGHFPGQPIFPGVLILEALAQVAGVLGFKSMEKTDKLYLLQVLIMRALKSRLFQAIS